MGSTTRTGSGNRRALARARRHSRVRKRVSGTARVPRLVVFRSSRHTEVQVIDDTVGRTLAAAATMEADVRGSGDKTAQAAKIGVSIAARAREAGVTRVVFDRGGYRYHGRVAAVAQGARDGGLIF